jgi:ribonuclease BN (tRNA processing enzyme)
MLRLTVLGNSGPYPPPGGACSGYFLESGQARLLLDFGSGALSNFFKVAAAPEVDHLDAVILTHLHADHLSDLLVLRHVLDVHRKRGRLPLYCPDEPANTYGFLKDFPQFDITPIRAELALTLGDLDVAFAPMRHPCPTYAVSVTGRDGGGKFVFSGDTAWNETLLRFAARADLLLLDAGLGCGAKPADGTKPLPAHLTPAECGQAAVRARAGKLLLTHFPPDCNPAEAAAEAQEAIRAAVGGDGAAIPAAAAELLSVHYL